MAISAALSLEVAPPGHPAVFRPIMYQPRNSAKSGNAWLSYWWFNILYEHSFFGEGEEFVVPSSQSLVDRTMSNLGRTIIGTLQIRCSVSIKGDSQRQKSKSNRARTLSVQINGAMGFRLSELFVPDLEPNLWYTFGRGGPLGGMRDCRRSGDSTL